MFPWDFIEGYTRILARINQPHVMVKDIAEDVLRFMIELFGADKGDLVLFRDSVDTSQEITEEAVVRFRLHEGYTAQQWQSLKESGVLLNSIRRALTDKNSLVIRDTEVEESGMELELSRLLANGSWMNHVLQIDGQVVAYIHLAHRERLHFDLEDFKDLQGVSLLLATALNLSRLWERERQHIIALIRTLNRVVEAKDHYTAGHVERVKTYSGLISRLLGLPEDQCRLIETAAYLHDLGKVGISDEILKKPGPLTAEERRIMMQHVPIGERILENLPFLEEARALASLHHEYVDGSGYGGMKELPVGARILSIADAWDALTTNRPYRTAMPVEDALKVITDLELGQWDSGIVDRFATWLGTEKFLRVAVEHRLVCMKRVGDGSEERIAYDPEQSVLKYNDFEGFYQDVSLERVATAWKQMSLVGSQQRFHLRGLEP